MDFKNINIGDLILLRVRECGLINSEVSRYLNIPESEVEQIYVSEKLNVELLLKLCYLLEYDFFRIYTQHMILYSPPSSANLVIRKKTLASLNYRKNIYTRQIIDFILEMMDKGIKTEYQIIEDYGIPKSTLYKWIAKYKKN